MVRIGIIAFSILFSACEAAQPELVNLFNDNVTKAPSIKDYGEGRLAVGAETAIGETSMTYKVRSRVSVIPSTQTNYQETSSYKVRGYVEL